jgi:hypothetical protein
VYIHAERLKGVDAGSLECAGGYLDSGVKLVDPVIEAQVESFASRQVYSLRHGGLGRIQEQRSHNHRGK